MALFFGLPSDLIKQLKRRGLNLEADSVLAAQAALNSVANAHVMSSDDRYKAFEAELAHAWDVVETIEASEFGQENQHG